MFEIVSVVLSVFGWGLAVVSGIYSFFKVRKVSSIKDEKEKAEEEARIESAKLKINEKIPIYCKNAEQLCGSKTGFTKYSLVVQWIQIDCLTEGIPYDEEYFKARIEDVLNAPEKKTSI